MGTLDRSKKRVQLGKKAIFHFSLCFVVGFFTGLAPATKDSIFSGHGGLNLNQSEENSRFSPEPSQMLSTSMQFQNLNLSSVSSQNSEQESQVEEEHDPELILRELLIFITTTRLNDRFQGAFLRRLGNTFKLVPSPLLWIVVEPRSDSSEISEILRKTGVMYRHLVFKENFTDAEAEMDYQRNLALNHIEHHRLNGIVHFAGVSNFYDLEFFDKIREIEVFGTWPMALLSANRDRVAVEGPVCESFHVIGWHLRRSKKQISPIHISSFAFNSSILWDPERWGRVSSIQDTSQNSIKFVQEVIFEDESKLKGVSDEDCSKIMVWHLHIPTPTM